MGSVKYPEKAPFKLRSLYGKLAAPQPTFLEAPF
jgi:hypothetical protein